MAGRLLGTLAASSLHGLLGPPALQRLGQWAGYDLPPHTTEWAERGLDLNDGEDVACLMDFLDSAGGIRFCNVRLRRALLAMDGAEPPGTAQASGAESVRAPAGDIRGSEAKVTATTRGCCGSRPAATTGAPRCAGPRARGAGEPAGPSGRRWDYSRFEGIGDSSDGGSEPGQ